MGRIILFIFPFLAIFGALNMIVSALVASCFISPDLEFPIIGVSDMEINNDTLYVASSFNSRVQVYNPQGNYLGRHSTLNYGKPFMFQVVNNEIYNLRIYHQGINDLNEFRIKIKLVSGKIEYRFKYRKTSMEVRQSIFIHFLFNPIFGVCFCFIGVLGTLVTNEGLRNRLLSARPR